MGKSFFRQKTDLELSLSKNHACDTMHKFERFFKLHALLHSGHPVSMKRMREALDASRATVNRDLEYMRLFLHAPIIYERAANGYRYDPDAPTFELPGLWFNESELFALLASEQMLESLQPGLLAPYTEPLRQRIRELIAQSGHSAETVSQRICLHSFGRRQTQSATFATVAQAVLECRMLSIHYHSRSRDQTSSRCLQPRLLLHYRDNWYLIAHCEKAQALRTFSLDRIREAVLHEAPAAPGDESELQDFLGSSFGIFSGPVQHWAVLRFSAARAAWVADEVWHPDQVGAWRDDAYELRLPYADPTELIMEILKHGPEVQVLEPAELREMAIGRLEAAWRQYQK